MTPARGPLRVVLLAVIAVGLLLIGGGAAVALGIGRGEPAPAADSVAAGFSRDMARHHLQGVEMANAALERSTDPEVRRLAFDIAETQQNQVGRMQGWLALWGLPPTAGETMAWMGAHGGHTADGGLMPGMATEEELARLRSLSGVGFDREFLRLMIRHHQGGYDMARYAAEHAAVPAVAGLAGTVAETQAAEVTTMERMLAARGGTPLPAP
ncbi:Uncharacterized conserved protein, DUF305 family [Geodermatophilus pulveris]|uniref:Uncharacterized conserved protein, DUF305 family n=1 Tax=Geodermatophilus pulveris TaxID=1564159 RepID=A0A239B7R3_9ACTN|nr:DUF305 domain-containing protein [Geodermatophilus pulveris]SNS03995.1 Uncharacterized conserved protein, DUF305 family [Geodermatophilus pulveris]